MQKTHTDFSVPPAGLLEPMLKNRRFLILLALAALLALLFAQAVSQNSPAPQVTFTSLKGEKISMQSLHGKVGW